MTYVYALIVLACTVWTLAGFVAVVRVVRRPPAPRPTVLPAVTVLKPLAGVDAHLAENLTTFFEQDHPDYEIVFGVEDPNDPAIDVVESIRQRYPGVAARLVVHEGLAGTNPKVRNLRGMVEHARHDLLVVSDSNIRVPAHYVSELAAEMARGGGKVGLVTNPIRGILEDGLGAALGSVELAGFCAAGIAAPSFLGEGLVVGKSMLFSRRVFESLGGFDGLSNVIAEDYVMGKMFEHAGYEVVLAPTVVSNVMTGTTVRAALARHRRWAMLRWCLRPGPYLLEPLTSPLVLLPVAWHLFGPAALAWTLLLLWVRDAGQWIALGGAARAWIPLLVAPLRDLGALFVWIRAPFCRHVRWRGNRVRLSAGTVGYATLPRRPSALAS